MVVRARPFADVRQIGLLLRDCDWASPGLVTRFEAAFAEFIGTPYAAATHQGRSALLLALKALNVGSQDEVIVQSLICRVVIDAILETGAMPVLVDNSLDDYQILPAQIREKITPRTKVIIVAHLYGIPCQIEEICEIARENTCYLIEDCAHSLGVKYNRENTGTYGDMAFFSFNFDKPISVGNGGMLVVNSPELISRISGALENYERMPLQTEREIVYGFILQHLLTQKDIYHQCLPTTFGEVLIRGNPSISHFIKELLEEDHSGAKAAERISGYLEDNDLLHKKALRSVSKKLLGKMRSLLKRLAPDQAKTKRIDQKHLLMNSLRAMVGLEQLKHLDSVIDARNRNAKYLAMNLDEEKYISPKVDPKSAPIFFRYPVLARTGLSVSEVAEVARRNGFEIGNYNWPKPIHLTHPYRRILSYDAECLVNSRYIAEQLLNIPNHFYITEDNLEAIAVMLNNFN
ncbi:DegT/DnrJ/EryC1/StrS family aminotransferase [Candidatus Poribacteria bacterium]